jgi:hypothetical protein
VRKLTVTVWNSLDTVSESSVVEIEMEIDEKAPEKKDKSQKK